MSRESRIPTTPLTLDQAKAAVRSRMAGCSAPDCSACRHNETSLNELIDAAGREAVARLPRELIASIERSFTTIATLRRTGISSPLPASLLTMFVAWLTTLPGTLAIGSEHDASEACDALHRYIALQGFAESTDEWMTTLALPHDPTQLSAMELELPAVANAFEQMGDAATIALSPKTQARTNEMDGPTSDLGGNESWGSELKVPLEEVLDEARADRESKRQERGE